MTETAEQADVPCVQTVPESSKQAAPAYTPEQIEKFCGVLENLSFSRPMTSGIQALEIIRQLQDDIAERIEHDRRNFEALRACSMSARE